jgi:hypothetical protein
MHNVNNKDSMDIEREVQIIAYEIQTGKEEFVKGTKRILALFSVVDSEAEYCDRCGELKEINGVSGYCDDCRPKNR